MKNKIVAERYAEGFFSLAREAVGLEPLLAELKFLKSVLRDVPDFKFFLESPTISIDEKQKMIGKVLAGNCSQSLLDFLFFLVEKRRVDLLSEIMDYLRVRYSNREAVNALLQVSSVLDLEVLQTIKEKIEMKLKRRLKFFVHLDAQLLGGFEVTVGNTLFDGSIEGALIELKEKLSQIRVN